MKLRTKLMLFTAAAALSANMAFAAVDPNALVAEFQAQGYTSIEVTVGPTQTRVEAVREGEKVETIYDTATGVILQQEIETPDEDDLDDLGFEIEFEDEDFLDGDDDDEDDEGDDDEGDDDEGDDDEDDDEDDEDDEDEGEGGGSDGGGDDDGDDD